MCGLVGHIANRQHGFNNDEVKAFSDMLYINALRGKDSTGIFYVTNSGEVQTHKEVGEAGKFLKTKEWEASEKELFRNGQAVIGHCRASTRGAKTDTNAHPFIVDNKIVLVHNGTYNGSHSHLAKTDVDSHAIAHVLAEEPDVAAALRKVDAAYALVWYNADTKHLYAIRNQHRTLFFGQLEDGSMMFASEIAFLYTAAWRNSLEFTKGYPVILPEHQLFSCNLDDIRESYKWDDIDCGYVPPVREVPVTVYPKRPLALVHNTDKGNNKGQTNHFNSIVEAASHIGLGKHTVVDVGWHGYAKRNDILFVEAVDYYQLNNSNIYYIYGKVISNNKNLDGTIAGWEITSQNELEVLDYVSSRFYDCKVEYNLSRGLNRIGQEVTSIWKCSEATETTTTPVETMELH